MRKKAFTLQNKGMNRDLSVSKAGESSAYENHNIRILAREHDTMFSVTNERGNKEIPLTEQINGTLLGWNVLNEHLVLFTTETVSDVKTDYIYRIDYHYQQNPEFVCNKLFFGDLNFDIKNPIESVVDFESENIQKIYWVDGRNVLRMMNFADEEKPWYDSQTQTCDNTYFDSNRIIDISAEVKVEKDNSGNTRANGVVQYILVYYNRHSQESGIAWMSDLIYLSPNGIGGSPDGYNNNKITLKISNLDKSYGGYRIYSIFKSSYEGTTVAYLVAEGDITDDASALVIDDNSHLTAIDASSLLYLGSKNVIAGTLAHKDQTLFLGDLQSVGRGDRVSDLQEAIRENMFILNGEHFVPGTDWEIKDTCLHFDYSVDGDVIGNEDSDIKDIPYLEPGDAYAYDNQLKLSSSCISGFKGGEKYRFGLVFFDASGASSDVFWIGDKVNEKYPVIDKDTHKIKRIIAVCQVPSAVLDIAKDDTNYDSPRYVSARLVIARATYADRAVKAQGVLNPTMFNVWDRFNGRLYSMPSWISRPRHSGYANRHFDVVHKSTQKTGEIQCNYWESTETPTPYYQVDDYGTPNAKYHVPIETDYDYDYILITYNIQVSLLYSIDGSQVVINVIKARIADNLADDTAARNAILSFDFTTHKDDFSITTEEEDKRMVYKDSDGRFSMEVYSINAYGKGSNYGAMMDATYADMYDKMRLNGLQYPQHIIDENIFHAWFAEANQQRTKVVQYNKKFPSHYAYISTVGNVHTWDEVADYYDSQDYTLADRWVSSDTYVNLGVGPYNPAYYSKNLMFVDENVLTFESPEISYESAMLDDVSNCKFRIIGLAKVSGSTSDSIVNATHGMYPGQNLANNRYSAHNSVDDLDGLQSWPMWDEFGLEAMNTDKEKKYRVASDYIKGGNKVRYWLHMFNHSGKIDEYTNAESPDDYSRLSRKIFANRKYCYNTIFNNSLDDALIYDPECIRMFNYTSSQYVGLRVGGESKNYDAYIDDALSMPGTRKYPILYSTDLSGIEEVGGSDYFLNSSSIVPLTFASNPHAVIALPTVNDTEHQVYKQTILPYIDLFENEEKIIVPPETSAVSGWLAPWIEDDSNETQEIVTEVNFAYGEHELDMPTFTLESREDDWSKASISFNFGCKMADIDPTDTEKMFYSRVWARAKNTFWTEPVYVRIDVSEDLNLYTILIDISYSYIDEGITEDIVRVNNATVIAVYDDEEIYQNVKAVLYEDNDGVVDQGSKVLVLSSGALNDVQPGYYPYVNYDVDNTHFDFTPAPNAEGIAGGERYFFIGELYFDYDSGLPQADPRYGGISEAAIKSNVFVNAGPRYDILDNDILHANQGDTYFQRWDNLRTKPLDKEDVNGVVDIISVMLESHINLDGRYDKQRTTGFIASIDEAQFGDLNRVYSQPDNFKAYRDLDDDYDLDAYRSSLTWTLEKHSSALTDEWMHITLASTLDLDGDKGVCRAIRRFQNSLIAFQDRGIAEILFNSRTQLSTTNGVPIEIANSGKVDGKRYITNKYGCTNKWSIVEGKRALYFVDNINKMFGALGDGIDNISTRLGFSAFFKKINDIKAWNPGEFNNIISFYDRINSDVYLVRKDSTDDQDCLVYNENLDAFSSFFDYGSVPMMTNLSDRFVSFKKVTNKSGLWLQNEGFYCNFFGTQYNFWTTYRATPDPYGDKIWTNVEYRADVFRMFDEYGVMNADEGDFVDTTYLANETFDTMSVWNEYQNTGDVSIAMNPVDSYSDTRKKFRIWRMDIPRAVTTASNKYGLDRIRNPWVNIKFKKTINTALEQHKNLMQIHDLTMIYFE